MAISPSLLLRQSQSLVMTPQLMQSIQLLQMNHLELVQFIDQEVEKNPLLEIAASEEMSAAPETNDTDTAHANGDLEGDGDWLEPGSANTAEQLSDKLDTNFATEYDGDSSDPKPDAPELLGQWKSMPGSQGDSGAAFDMDDLPAARMSLREFVHEQIPLAFFEDTDRVTAQYMADLLDDSGYLCEPISETAARLGVDNTYIESILTRLQTLEPAGIFARGLAECLAIQLRQRNRLDPAMSALVDNLQLLAKRDFATLKKVCGVAEDDLIDMLAEIRSLDPKPGSAFQSSQTETVVPDVIVRPGPKGGWQVELNPDTLPRVLVNQEYFSEISRKSGQNSADMSFLSECMQNANWLVRSLDQRARTILKVATEIVIQQDAFMEHGVEHLRPLNLKTVADAIKMHESTVSRVTSNKFMLTPRGLFELKYFFTVSIAASDGGDSHSAEAVRNRIKAMIEDESPDAVLSDDDIMDHLKGKGINIARRTVAKYREAMNIPSSVQRRREKRAMAKVSSN
ncbi:RNA polymerase factor sigma-54 [Rhizobium sp. L1K21]|uniref:RNA polymerase factor sigma-54 n=1 Tax=Rhizobium sp. L1K21 TaxID=2954933 RepID=UPI002092B35F|nr:RNA polymerase factor sigma-54 [Rhizobium sp. L1K21]MCO6187066.1 RNA polymerase factor sigma-54 [Rhizobium sp. L1K21]